ncbi:MAG: CPBP family intramembrane glutamic endopeptidase [Ferruginibacter sp.]
MNTGIGTISKYLLSYLFFNNPLRLLLMMIFMAAVIYANYYEPHFFNSLLKGNHNSWFRSFAGYSGLYAIPFLLAYTIQDKKLSPTFFKNKWFIVLLLLAPVIFAFRVNFNFHHSFLQNMFEADALIFWRKCIDWVIRVFVVMIPLYFLWRWKDKHVMPFYGSAWMQTVRPYVIMLLIMIPLICWAASQESFLHMYPRARVIQELDVRHNFFHYLVYELSYGFDFISIEFFFRGFLILAFMRIAGMYCILPAACFYCCIHLGKPMPEAISSFFGGLILGTVSYHTKSIWGGFIVHLGIAWMMEIAGFIAYAMI